MAEHLLHYMRKFGNYRITSACRSEAEQRRLYDDYLHGKNEFPVAPPGQSMHQRGLAVDIAQRAIDPYRDLFLHVVGASWRSLGHGFRWSEDDPIHFEWLPS